MTKYIIPITKDQSRSIRSLLKHVSKDESRPGLAGIHVAPRGANGLSYATNGFQLVATEIPTLQEHAGKHLFPTTIPTSGGDMVAEEISHSSPPISATITNITTKSDGKYVHVDAQRMAAVLSNFTGMVRIEIRDKMTPVEIRASTNEGGARYAILMPMHARDENDFFLSSELVQATNKDAT